MLEIDHVGCYRWYLTEHLSEVWSLPVYPFTEDVNFDNRHEVHIGGIIRKSKEEDAVMLKWCKAIPRPLENSQVIDEPRKLGHVKVNKLIQVTYCDCGELRGVDLYHEVLQILMDTMEPEGGESWKDDPCCGRQANLVRARSQWSKLNLQRFEPDQRGQTCNQCFWRNIARMRYSMLRSSSMTRPLADGRSIGNAGKGVPFKLSSSKYGADLSKKSLGRTGTFLSSARIPRHVSAGNGSCIIVPILPNWGPVHEEGHNICDWGL